MNFNHKTVLLSETLDFLNIDPCGIYVDATAGGAGLSKEIALRLSPKGKLICIDQDPDAINVCKERLKEFRNVETVQGNFADIINIVHNLGISNVNGIVLDIGVSSYQLDFAQRGFSYKNDAPLDMRMSKSGLSAYDVVNNMPYEKLRNIISKYGEERFAPVISRKIVEKREKASISTTGQLAEIVKDAVPCAVKRGVGHPARKTFQAIRIYVNKELENLETALESSIQLLDKGGRIAVITFHSLEDRITKQKMNAWVKSCVCPSDFPICVCGKLSQVKLVNKKPIIPCEKEIEINPRSRSAKLRVCEKI